MSSPSIVATAAKQWKALDNASTVWRRWIPSLPSAAVQIVVALVAIGWAQCAWANDALEFFEQRVRPALVEHCYRCHSADAKELQGGLRLDLKSGWQTGGDSGQPAIVPGQPQASLLMRSIEHADDASHMPPNQAKLPARVIADLAKWIETGAVDPREGTMVKRDKQADWEVAYQRRLDWWSLKPVSDVAIPTVSATARDAAWMRNEIDAFILPALESQGISPSLQADKATLARRLSLTLTGLPLDSQKLEAFLKDESPDAVDRLTACLLDSPRFGERWARHWMDVVHYSDTHGYEWDVPVKNSWRYRDYLIRAFNNDVSYQQLILEQLAGDLVPPRIDASTGVNEALIGPLMLRLGERRHGDNSAIEGISQEAVANMIDTIGKAFLGTTLACAQCHDHKLDAVEQRDYYSLAGMLMSTRFSARPIDLTMDGNQDADCSNGPAQSADRHNRQVIDRLRAIKARLRTELAQRWLQTTELSPQGDLVQRLRAIKADEKPVATFPATILEVWKRSLSMPITSEEFAQERQRRLAANQANLTLLADFRQESSENSWRWEGMGMRYGLVSNGELVVSDSGDQAIVHLLPAGRFSHAWSSRLAGSLQSPALDPSQPITFSIETVAGKFASQSFIVDRALNPERLTFPNHPLPTWQRLTAGNFDSLEGTIDRAPRRVYFELATKSLNNYFPPRVGYGGLGEVELNDPRSWFGVTCVYTHAPDKSPQDDLERFEPLFTRDPPEADWALRLVGLLRESIARWAEGKCSAADVQLLNDALQNKLLPCDLVKDSQAEQIVMEYRQTEQELREDQTVGTVAEWPEGADERLAIRGVYTDLAERVPRGSVRFLGCEAASDQSSGRLPWAQRIASADNPLTARVYVNRVWHYLFGNGLVRTTDDFGHLGQQPSHPELLDYLAQRFVAEGWSTKRLIHHIVSSATWRQSSLASARGMEVDPENRLLHHMPIRRLEAEALRDSLLVVSGRWDTQLYGPAIEPYRTAEDATKRLSKGPLDGLGRRSIYLEMTLMEPPRFLALFNQPLPKQTVGRRDVTNVPDQALAMLNDPFVVDMAGQWSKRLVHDGATCAEQRAGAMITTALGRPAHPDECQALAAFAAQMASQRKLEGELLQQAAAWQDAAHAVFNLKEFLYVP